MADLAPPQLTFPGKACPDCGRREILLPPPLPEVGDDFDWQARDYDGFRLAMLEELAARFPERNNWTPADLEVVLVEAVAAVLDQLSDMLDRVTGEAYLGTARRPESVYELLTLIGYMPSDRKNQSEMIAKWREQPWEMERVRHEGPRAIRRQQRMVSAGDYADRVQAHPLVERASANIAWGGSWTLLTIAVILPNNNKLEAAISPSNEDKKAVKAYHDQLGVPEPVWRDNTTYREVLTTFVETLRMIGQEVQLRDAVPVGIYIALTVRLSSNYYQSEVRRAIEQRLSPQPGGLFEPGNLAFGEDLYLSDVVQGVMQLAGVENVCVDHFKRVGQQFPDEIESERIKLSGLEIAVCDNKPGAPERGYVRIRCAGGQKG
jgi:hypothetical protein